MGGDAFLAGVGAGARVDRRTGGAHGPSAGPRRDRQRDLGGRPPARGERGRERRILGVLHAWSGDRRGGGGGRRDKHSADRRRLPVRRDRVDAGDGDRSPQAGADPRAGKRSGARGDRVRARAGGDSPPRAPPDFRGSVLHGLGPGRGRVRRAFAARGIGRLRRPAVGLGGGRGRRRGHLRALARASIAVADRHRRRFARDRVPRDGGGAHTGRGDHRGGVRRR